MARLGEAMQRGEQTARAIEAGQDDLFGLTRRALAAMRMSPAPSRPDWSEAQRLAGERETLGLYLTGHPIARLERDLARFVCSHRRSAERARPAQPGRTWSAGAR